MFSFLRQIWIILLISFSFALHGQSGNAQIKSGRQAINIYPGSDLCRMKGQSNIPDFMLLRGGQECPLEAFPSWLPRIFGLPDYVQLVPRIQSTDRMGITHVRYDQFYKGIRVENAEYSGHAANGMVYSMNGMLFDHFPAGVPGISEQSALQYALDYVHGILYQWQIPAVEKWLKVEQSDPTATYYPKGELVYYSPTGAAEDLQLCYRFDVYCAKPLSRQYVYVDANSGAVAGDEDRILDADVNGTATTVFSGNQSIVADDVTGPYRLRESGRGNGIETYDMGTGTNYGNAVDFTDNDNFWNNVNPQLDEYATDAHWGAEMTYDYYLNQHGRNSIDGNGFKLLSYVHYDVNFFNAFWDGQRMTYGDGNGTPLTTMDITGHEITHGLTENTSNLIYQNESGALNESFSDIFGTAIEFYAKPSTADWLIAAELGSPFRSMSNPPAYGDPDTYMGTNYYTGAADNGGVHTNSGVQNKWFYILSMGETGTNDLGNNYSVTGIGINNAADIAFRNNTVYLTSGAQFADARFYAIQSAIDLFGACSPEVIACTDAWYAVGVGGPWDPTVIADFTAPQTSGCATPFTVNFQNLSQNGGSFYWNFGDGSPIDSTSSPSHTYTALGTFDVTLIADGGACGSDTNTYTAFISVDTANPCIVQLPLTGNAGTQSGCTGTIYDDGGPAANYTDNTNSWVTISPPGASQVQLTFASFAMEPGSNNNCDYDYLEIYDGPGTASPLIGHYCNDTGSPGTVTSTGGSITIRQYSDVSVNYSGFEANWQCILPSQPPIADYNSDETTTCDGTIQFYDLSSPAATSWLWDFGDGNTSNLQNPTHTYVLNGSYTVTLWATNSIGTDSIAYVNYITVNRPAGPTTLGDSACFNNAASLSATGSGSMTWYDDSISGNQVGTGSTFVTPPLTVPVTYWVSESITQTSQYVGPVDNTFGAGGYYQGNRHLLFDVFGACTLVSVWVDAGSSGTRTVELRDNTGTVLQSAAVNIPAGQSRITLNFSLTPGTSYQLGVQGNNSDLYRNSANASYPYTIPGLISITGCNAPSSYYYFFYDWEVQGAPCVSERSPASATVLPAPTISVTGSTNICQGNNATLNATGTAISSYLWSPGGQTTSSVTVGPASTATYTVTGSNICGSDNASITVNVTPLPTVTASADVGICAGNSTTLSATGNGSFLWSPGGQTTSSITITPSATTSYVVSSTNACGSANDTVVVAVSNLPVISVTGSDSICQGSNGLLSASGTDISTYSWQPGGQTTANITVSPAVTTAYTVMGSNSCGSDTANLTLTVMPLPTVSAPADASICLGDSITLTATGNGGFLWTPGGQITASIVVNPTTQTTYYVSHADACGNAIDSVTVSVTGQPTLSISGNNTICPGDTAVLTASGSGNIVWSPQGQTSSNISVSPATTTTYYATSTSSCGTASDSITITVSSTPILTVSSDTTICSGDIILLTANGNGSFLWSPGGQNTNTISVSPVSGLTYYVTMTGTCGSATDSISVQVNPVPFVAAVANTTICSGDSVLLSATGTGTMIWQPGNVSGSSFYATPLQNTTYTVTTANSCGNASDSVLVSVQSAPTAVFTPSSGNLTVTFTNASVDGSIWFWDFGDGNTDTAFAPTHTYGIAGVYTVMLIATNNCGSDTAIQQVVVEDLGTDESQGEMGFALYPNPARAQVTLDYTLPDGFDAVLVLRNMLGQEVLRRQLPSGASTLVIDTRALPSGAYSLDMTHGVQHCGIEQLIIVQ